MLLDRPGLWQGRLLSLACSALQGGMRAQEPLWSRSAHAWQTPLSYPGAQPLLCTHRGCSSLAAILAGPAWSWLRCLLSTILAGESLV